MSTPIRRIHNDFELRDLIDRVGRDPELVERDFALVTVAANLVDVFGQSLCFKGGFVLRHVYGHERFSRDIDATRINPPKNKLDATEVAASIRGASIQNLLRFRPQEPATDSGRSLDFDHVDYFGSIQQNGVISVEVSYREDVIDGPALVPIGPPYYEPFLIPAMQLNEIVAEKLRALAQRDRPTDLADLAMIVDRRSIDEGRVRQLVAEKFKLAGNANKRAQIERRVEQMRRGYDEQVLAVASDAPDYVAAAAAVLSKLPQLLP